MFVAERAEMNTNEIMSIKLIRAKAGSSYGHELAVFYKKGNKMPSNCTVNVKVHNLALLISTLLHLVDSFTYV